MFEFAASADKIPIKFIVSSIRLVEPVVTRWLRNDNFYAHSFNFLQFNKLPPLNFIWDLSTQSGLFPLWQ